MYVKRANAMFVVLMTYADMKEEEEKKGNKKQLTHHIELLSYSFEVEAISLCY